MFFTSCAPTPVPLFSPRQRKRPTRTLPHHLAVPRPCPALAWCCHEQEFLVTLAPVSPPTSCKNPRVARTPFPSSWLPSISPYSLHLLPDPRPRSVHNGRPSSPHCSGRPGEFHPKPRVTSCSRASHTKPLTQLWALPVGTCATVFFPDSSQNPPPPPPFSTRAISTRFLSLGVSPHLSKSLYITYLVPFPLDRRRQDEPAAPPMAPVPSALPALPASSVHFRYFPSLSWCSSPTWASLPLFCPTSGHHAPSSDHYRPSPATIPPPMGPAPTRAVSFCPLLSFFYALLCVCCPLYRQL